MASKRARARKPAKPRAPARTRQVPVTAVVQRQYFEGRDPKTEQDTKNETIEVRTFVTEPATVSVDMGLTLNLGNYESARIGVSFVVPCYREEADSAYEYAKTWVESRVGKEVADVRANKPRLFQE